MRQFNQIRMAKVVVILAVVLIVSIATIGQDVRSNHMPGTNFEKYHTYKWVNIESAAHPNQILDAQIKQSIDAQLALEGLTKTDSDKADVYVSYQIALGRERQWNAYGTGGIRWGGMGMGSATSSTVTNGSLVLDMYDPTTKELVWTGSATKAINTSGDQKKIQKNLDKAMRKLLKNYPPKQS